MFGAGEGMGKTTATKKYLTMALPSVVHTIVRSSRKGISFDFMTGLDQQKLPITEKVVNGCRNGLVLFFKR